MNLDGQPQYQPFPNYNSYVAELVSGTVYVPFVKDLHRRIRMPEFILYVDNLLADIRIAKATGIVALIYCDRLRQRLPRNARGSHDTIYRVYTAALVLACKYCGENFSLTDVAAASGIFKVKDISKMEYELLRMLDYQTWVTDTDIRSFFDENQDGLYSALQPKEDLPL